MRSSDWTYVALALLAFAVSGGLFFYLGIGYGTTTGGPQQVSKVVVPIDSEADDLLAELQALKAEKQQLTEEVAALTTGREALEQESQAFRKERDHLLAFLAGDEKNLDAVGEEAAQLAATGQDTEATLAAALTETELPAIETAAGSQEPTETQIARLPDAPAQFDEEAAEDAPAIAESPAQPKVRVIYPSGTTEVPISLQMAPVPLGSTLDKAVVSQALAAGLEAFKDGEYRLAYDTWLPLAEAGVRRAQFYVGGLFHDGRGIEADIVKAHYWLSLSDQAGYPLSRPLLTEIEAKMSPQERARAQNLLAGKLPVSQAN